MNGDVHRDLGDSAYDFLRVVWPAVGKKFFGDGEIIPVETDTGILARRWDALAGVDVWQVRDGTGMRGIASRIQWIRPGWAPYNTFTVRKARDNGTLTEFEKRLRAIDNPGGWLYPVFTIQAFVQEPRGQGSLLSAAAAKTADVIRMIRDGQAKENRTSNAEFYHVAWSAMKRAEYEVRTWDSARERAA